MIMFNFSFWLHICRDHLQPGLTVMAGLETVARLAWTSQLRLLATFPLTRSDCWADRPDLTPLTSHLTSQVLHRPPPHQDFSPG